MIACNTQIYDDVLANGDIYENLRTLTKGIGHRLSGSHQAAQAMVWGADLLKKYEADNVFVMPVTVPSWSRNDVANARVILSGGKEDSLHITALGGSVQTPKDKPLRAKVVVVKHLNELKGRDDIKGKIVLFNRAMDPLLINTGAAYGGAMTKEPTEQ